MNPILMQQILVILLRVLLVELALVNKLHCDTMCYSKCLKVESISSLNDQLSINGIHDPPTDPQTRKLEPL